MHGRSGEADVVMDIDPPLPHDLMDRADYRSQQMTIVLGPDDIFLAINVIAENAAGGLADWIQLP
jgi:hypothetical protein